MANSSTILADLKTVLTANNIAVKAATAANAVNPTALSATGGSGNLTGGTGAYGSGTYVAGPMDYLGHLNLLILKAQELAILLAKVTVNTDQATDGTNQSLLVNILNDLQ
jgi:hypothetical protein